MGSHTAPRQPLQLRLLGAALTDTTARLLPHLAMYVLRLPSEITVGSHLNHFSYYQSVTERKQKQPQQFVYRGIPEATQGADLKVTVQASCNTYLDKPHDTELELDKLLHGHRWGHNYLKGMCLCETSFTILFFIQ